MSRKISKTVRLEPADIAALAHAKADGVSASELVRPGLRIAAAQYYARGRRRPPKVDLFVCTDPNLGEEWELYKDFRG